MKKFIRGTFELEQNIGDFDAYEDRKELYIKSIIQWAKEHDIDVILGESEDNCYLCEYIVKANTSALCKGYVSELKHMLKIGFPKMRLLYQASGNLLR